jgi:pyruvate/2-oxoglutarate dehydrogenase complex dihydrolipoamide acyltransferase (E2) component
VAVEVLLPKLGLTMEEGTVDEWLVGDGDPITVGTPLLRLATDKVDVDVEAEAAGLFHRAVPAGTTLPPGAVIGWVLEVGEAPPAASAAAPPAPAAAAATTPTAAVAPAPVAANAGADEATRGEGGRVLSSPYARRRADELGVAITAVSGTGPGGRVIAADVEERAAAQSAAGGPVLSPLVRRDAAQLDVPLGSVPGSGPGGRITRDDVRSAARLLRRPDEVTVIPLKGMRGAIASRMVASLHEMAQLTHGFEVSMDAVVAVRAELKRDWPEMGLAVPSLNDFVVRAAALALREHPGLNAEVVGAEIRLLPAINVGMAVAVPGGLVVPVIRDADRLSLQELSGVTRTLAAKARDGKLSLPEMEGGSFAVTSLGTYGVDFFTPVINPGNVAILGVGRLRDGVRWTDDDQPVRTRVLTLSLTFDHRAVDGAPAAEYLQTVAELLTRPMVLVPDA